MRPYWRVLRCSSAFICAALLFATQPLGAQQLPKAPDDAIQLVPVQGEGPCGPDEYIPRLLRVIVNTGDSGRDLIAFQRPCGALIIRQLDAEALRMRTAARPTIEIDGDRWINLNNFPGLSYALDLPNQRLFIEGEPWIFYPTVLRSGIDNEATRPETGTGVFLNYGAFVSHDLDRKNTNGNLNASLGLFHPQGLLVSNWASSITEQTTDILRLNTTFARDLFGPKARLQLGDVVTDAGRFGSRVSAGGVQFASNLALRQFSDINPTTLLDAATSRSATLAVYRTDDGLDPDDPRYRQLVGGSTVPHGPVEVVDLPIYRSGVYELVLEDANGNVVRTTRRHFFSQSLLTKGRQEFNYAAGWRRGSIFGDRYVEPVYAGTHRAGLLHWLTGEVHAEHSEDKTAAGVTARLAMPILGAVSLTGAYGEDALDGGPLGAITVENRFRRWGYALATSCMDAGFANLGGRSAAACSTVVSGGTAVRGVSLSLAAGQSTRRGADTLRRYSLSFTGRIPGLGGTFTTSTSLTDVDGRSNWQAFASLRASFANVARAFGQRPRRRGRFDPATTRARLNTSVNRGGEPAVDLQLASRLRLRDRSVALSAATGVLNRDFFAIGGNYSGSRVNTGAFYNRSGGSSGTLAGYANSGLVLMDWSLFFTRQQLSSFALVRLGDENAGVRVSGLRANRRGDVVVPNLAAYIRNTLQVNPDDLPLNTRLDSLKFDVVPAFRTGVILSPEITRVFDAIIKITMPGDDGAPVPLPYSATVMARGAGEGEASPVNLDGEVYLTGLSQALDLRVFHKRRTCNLSVELPDPDSVPDDAILELGPYHCGTLKP